MRPRNVVFSMAIALLVSALVVPQPAVACSATCSRGSCTGTNTCKCEGGSPVCTDLQPENLMFASLSNTETDMAWLSGYIEHVGGLEGERFAKLTEAATELQQAISNDDLNRYRPALAAIRAELSILGLAEAATHANWSGFHEFAQAKVEVEETIDIGQKSTAGMCHGVRGGRYLPDVENSDGSWCCRRSGEGSTMNGPYGPVRVYDCWHADGTGYTGYGSVDD